MRFFGSGYVIVITFHRKTITKECFNEANRFLAGGQVASLKGEIMMKKVVLLSILSVLTLFATLHTSSKKAEAIMPMYISVDLMCSMVNNAFLNDCIYVDRPYEVCRNRQNFLENVCDLW